MQFTGESPFACGHCWRTFSTQSDWLDHDRTHSHISAQDQTQAEAVLKKVAEHDRPHSPTQDQTRITRTKVEEPDRAHSPTQDQTRITRTKVKEPARAPSQTPDPTPTIDRKCMVNLAHDYNSSFRPQKLNLNRSN